jgi:uncharacterized iron-regulated protein
MKKMISGLIALTLSACSSLPTPPSSRSTANQQQIPANAISVIALKNTTTLTTILPQLAQARVVLVGESHTAYGDHLNQLAVIKNLHPHWQQVAIGLEFVQTPYQQALDDYIAKKTDEKTMLRHTHWYDRWRYDFRLYRPIFNYARQHHIPLIALNTPREITKRISEVGIKGLTKTERAQLPQQIDQTNQHYRKTLKKVYQRHGGKSHSKKFERFYQTQLAWDETMANQAAKYLNKHLATRMIILAGKGHIAGRYGIPSRLQRRIKSKPIVILSGIDGNLNSSQADYLLFSAKTELPKAGKMGILMKNTANGVLISKVLNDSASAKAGLKKGDLITHLNKITINTIEEVKIQMIDAKPKQKINISLQRSGKQKISKTIILQ